jgi:diguanylate cyclase (GGDEF)-like protein
MSSPPTPEQLLALVDAGPMGYLLSDSGGRIAWVNARLCEWLGVSPESLIGKTAADLTGAAAHLLAGSNTFTVQGPAGTQHMQRHSLSPAAGIVAAYAYTDISAQHRLASQLSEISLEDSITGLPNRRALMLTLEPQVSRSRRYDTPLTVVVMRLDYDADPTADTLRAISGMLKDQLRWADLVGIAADNEFILILPETRETDAARIIAKLEAGLAGLTTDRRLHAKFGIGEWEKRDDAHSLLQRATDAAQL